MNPNTALQILATVAAADSGQDKLAAVLGGLAQGNPEYLRLLESTWRALDATSQLRRLARGVEEQGSPIDLAALTRSGETILWHGHAAGRMQTLYKPILPVEWQARIAYESFIDRFIAFVQKRHKVLVLAEDDHSLSLFIPSVSQFNLATDWQVFVDEAFSARELQRTFMLTLNSVKLSQRGGFSVPEVPILTRGQAKVLAALLIASMLARQAGITRLERQIDEVKEELENLPTQKGQAKRVDSLKKKIKSLEEKRDKQTTRYGSSIAAMAVLEKRFPQDFRELKVLARGYTGTARGQLKVTGSVVRKYVTECERLLTLSAKDLYVLSPLLSDQLSALALRPASDNVVDACYVCGREFRSKEDRFEANKLVLSSPSQALQSKSTQVQPSICGTCSALAIASPLKLGNQSLVVRLREFPDNGRYLLEDQLRMFVLGEMNVFAGRYVMVSCTERIDGDPMIDKLGGTQYALWKVASIFPPDVFNHYRAEVILEKAQLDLPARHLAWLSTLLDVFGQLRTPRKLESSEFRALGQAIRYIQKEEVILAIYTLASALAAGDDYNVVQASHLENLRESHVRWLAQNPERRFAMNELADKARLFRDVAALTGMLYAFVRYAELQFQMDDDKKLAVKKILEKVENPHHFTYEVGGDTGRTTGILSRRNDTYFIFDEAKRFLSERLQVDVAQREQEARRIQPDVPSELLLVTFDDVDKAFATIFEERKTDKEQREFAYELKLSLYSRFPQYIPGAEAR